LPVPVEDDSEAWAGRLWFVLWRLYAFDWYSMGPRKTGFSGGIAPCVDALFPGAFMGEKKDGGSERGDGRTGIDSAL
jgi:hypothetical protein